MKRFRTLQLVATGNYDAAALAGLTESAAEARRTVAPDSVRLYGPAGYASGDVSFTWRVWWKPPALWRDDLEWPNGQTTVIIVRPDATLAYVSMQGTLYTSEPSARARHGHAQPPGAIHLPTVAERLAELPLIRPPLPLSEWELATLGREVYRGRAAQRVRATRRALTPPMREFEASGYWPVVDEYECLVDDALRILLRFAGLAGGVAVAAISADEVREDAPLPAEVFTFTPPPGTRVVYVARPR